MNNALNAICARAGKAHLLLMLAVYTYSACTSLARDDEPERSIQRLASFAGPKGWVKNVYNQFGGPGIKFRHGSHSISIELFGARGSQFTSIEAYMQSLQARGLVHPDLPPTPAGDLIVGDKKMPAYRVASFLPTGDPHVRSSQDYRLPVEETFVIVKAKERFFVLKFRVQGIQSPSQKVRDKEALEWLAFLRSFRLNNNFEKK